MKKLINFLKSLFSLLFNHKFLLFLTFLLLLSSYLDEKRIGFFAVYDVEDLFTFLAIYACFGFGLLIFLKFRKVKKYITIFLSLIIWLFLYNFLYGIITGDYHITIEYIAIFIFLIASFSAILFLLPFFWQIILVLKDIILMFIYLKKTDLEFSLLSRKKARKIKCFLYPFSRVVNLVYKPVVILIFLGLIGYSVYSYFRIDKLTDKVGLLENKLGGSRKITCNEQESIEKIKQSVVRVVGGIVEGSGFFVTSSGLILTNFHVIEFEPSPKIIMPDNTFLQAEILMVDKYADLAMLKIYKDVPPIVWGNPKNLEPAEELLAIGFPLGGTLPGEASVSKGFLSGRRYSKDIGIEYLQVDSTLNPGLSGGPMINICGEVVGINTAGLAGLGMAISSDSIKEKWMQMASTEDPLEGIERITFQPEKSPLDAVEAFYNYLKTRQLKKAYELLSDNFLKGGSFEQWRKGYEPLLDTSVIEIREVKNKKDTIFVKLTTKDLVDDEIVYKYFEGEWIVKKESGKWKLWDPEIKEVKNPVWLWFFPSEE